ncbi:MAG: Gfo/Idh/MocA family oxidoreductase [Pseudomonadota bacterium]
MSHSVRIGVAGAGVFGSHHAAKYAAHPGAALIGVFDPDRDRATELAARHAATAYSAYSDLLQDSDAVVIAAPAVAHFDLASAALAAGRHVFVEKPLAESLEPALVLERRARDAGVVLQVGHQERYVLAETGLFDRDRAPQVVRCVRECKGTGRCEDVSVVQDLMIHDIDIARRLTDAPIKSVNASGDFNDAEAEITLIDETIISLKASRRAAAPDRRMTLIYDDGVVEFDFFQRTLSNSTPARLRAPISGDDAPLAFKDPLGAGADQFLHAIREREAPMVSGADGLAAVEWASKILHAMSLAEHSGEQTERLRA